MSFFIFTLCALLLLIAADLVELLLRYLKGQ